MVRYKKKYNGRHQQSGGRGRGAIFFSLNILLRVFSTPVPERIVVKGGIAFFRPPLATGIAEIVPLNAVGIIPMTFSAIAVAAVRCWDGWRMCAHLLESAKESCTPCGRWHFSPTLHSLIPNATLWVDLELTYSDHIASPHLKSPPTWFTS